MKVPVLLPNIFDHPFTYTSKEKLKIGDYVEVPFGKKKMIGIIWDDFEEGPKKKFKIKDIIKKFTKDPLENKTIKFLNWFSDYNIVPKGMALKLHLVNNSLEEDYKADTYDQFNKKHPTKDYSLNIQQKKSLLEIEKGDKNFRVHVLQGTTGSGKTIVYFNAIKKKLNEGYQSLILLPEIGLTKEFEKNFISFFGFKPAIWHSSVTKKNKKIIWSGLKSGKIKVVIGARSALFLPFKKLGLITIDEEHDQSYKQDEGVNYHARDMAISRASFENIPINLISAVPSIETYKNIKAKKFHSSRLTERFRDAKLPDYEIIKIKKSEKKGTFISEELIEKVKENLSRNNQVLFFVNRRGYSPFVLCKNCLKTFDCPFCSINLVYHKLRNKVLCHYCGYSTEMERDCSSKDSKCDFSFSGPGVEKILEEIKKIFPDKNTLIFSSDTMNKKDSSSKIQEIIDNKINILIGTQLISKGFHFPNLNCIIVLDIDYSSRGYDLRSAEKTVQLYHQLSGRAGREGKPSTVYFQTMNLNSDYISQIVNPDPYIFLDKELILREKNLLPPFERFISIIVSAQNSKKSDQASFDLSEFLKKNLKVKILGPVNAPIYKVRGNYRNRILLRSAKNISAQKNLKMALKRFNIPKGIKLSVDVDPINFN